MNVEAQSENESAIEVRGARSNNLKNLNVALPAGKLVVITGPSGSGKSSLAIDTIVGEGQRQFIENLSSYSRQFIDQLPRPDVDEVRGLPPTVCINQRRGQLNPRSTVGTQTEIYDRLRLLFARVGTIHCPKCDAVIRQKSIDQIVHEVQRLGQGTKLMILAPMVRGQEGVHQPIIETIRKERLVRLRIDGEIKDIDDLSDDDTTSKTNIEAITDRIVVKPESESRLIESIRLADRLAEGLVLVVAMQREKDGKPVSNPQWEETLYSTRYRCPNCSFSIPEIEPRSFSFNSPHGRCIECDGLGGVEDFQVGKVVPTSSLAFRDGAVAAWGSLSVEQRDAALSELGPILNRLNATVETNWDDLNSGERELLWSGEGKAAIGLKTILTKEYVTCRSKPRLQELESFRGITTCEQCQGSRLGPAAETVQIGGSTIYEVSKMSLRELGNFLRDLVFETEDAPIAEPIIDEIQSRLRFLIKVGLEYLSLHRSVASLSGGEFQRIRLANAIGTGLTGICYVLDEPTIGLHSRDVDHLLETMRELQTRGNTILVVEHEEAIMRAADWIIDMGPVAGREGGRIVAEGEPGDLIAAGIGPTAAWLKKEMATETLADDGSRSDSIQLVGACGFNLKDVDVELPTGKLVAVSGVSGSGKTTLIRRTLYPALVNHHQFDQLECSPYQSLNCPVQFEKITWVDQAPIGVSGRGCLATYSGVFSDIRALFAATKFAKLRGYRSNRFSFNSEAGRCPVCKGLGQTRVEMKFLPDFYVPCQTCGGHRYNRETLRVKFNGKTIADILNLQVDDAIAFFSNIEKIHRVLLRFQEVGLGYVTLGQPSNTLSGGESQRLKLANELATPQLGKVLFLLDEPTTGLHFVDVERLANVLRALVNLGHSVVCIEHNLDLIRRSDWVIEMGPGAGEQGGSVVAAMRPDELAQADVSATGTALKNQFQNRS